MTKIKYYNNVDNEVFLPVFFVENLKVQEDFRHPDCTN